MAWQSIQVHPHHRALTFAFCFAISASLAAQEPHGRIVGVVVSKETGQALPYGVIAVPSIGLERFTTANGTFEVNDVPLGAVRLLVRRLGYVPQGLTVVVRVENSDTVRIELARVAVRLAEVVVRAYPECKDPGPPNPARDSALGAIYAQMRMNAQQYDLLARSHPFVYVMAAVRGHIDTAGTRSDDEQEVFKIDGLPKWKYQPGRIITRPDRRSRAELLVNIPTLIDFVDSLFVSNHCFHNGGFTTVDGATEYRLDFVASSKIKSSDFAGSMYLDTATYQIRRTVLQVLPPPPVHGISSMEVVTDFKEVLPSIPVISKVSSHQTFKTAVRGVLFPITFEEQDLVRFFFLGSKPGEVP